MAEFIVGSPLRKIARKRPWLQRSLWWVDFALVWSLIRLFSLLPVDFASRLGQRMGRWIGTLMRRKTAIYRENFAVAFPYLNESELEELAREAWGRAGRVLAEYPHLDKILADDERLEIVIDEPVPTYEDPSQPCVIVTAHLCNWEVVCSAMAKLGMPNASLYSPPTNPYLDRMLSDSRRALNCELLARDNSARPLMRAMKSGRTAGMVIDRRVDEGRSVSFFGHDKLSTLMPAKLAQKFDCAVVPVHVERLHDARYRVTFEKPISACNPDAGEQEQAVDIIQQVHGRFEDWIRKNPADWFCSKRLWDKNTYKPAANGPRADSDMDSYAA